MAADTRISSSGLLRAKLTMLGGPLQASYERLWARERQDQIVPSYLVLLYRIMQSTIPLMACAADRCKDLNEDPLAPALAHYFNGHIESERDHDVWALKDLENAGYDPEVVARLIPSPELAQLAGAQYYWILHCHPIMLLGYILLLEAYPPSASAVDAIRDASGIPETAFRTIRMHGELDPDHQLKLDAFLDSLPIERRHVQMIGRSMMHAVKSLAECVDAIRPIEWPDRPTTANRRAV